MNVISLSLRGTRTRRGFTLIELLVAVAIIAVLIAILLPTMAAARARAKTASCLAKLHSLGTAVGSYAADWDGVICYEYYWHEALLTYIAGTPDPNNAQQATKQYYNMFVCPSIVNKMTTSKGRTYAGNVNVFNYGDSVPFSSPAPAAAKLAAMSRPAEIIAFGDANQAFGGGESWWVFDWKKSDITGKWGLPANYNMSSIIPADPGNVDYPPQPNTTGLRYRHGWPVSKTSGSAGVIFFDYHAETITIKQLKVRNILLDAF